MKMILAVALALVVAAPASLRAAAPVAPVRSWASSPLAPDIVVAPDGTGHFKTVQAALDSIPRDNTERKVIFIQNGTYNEHLRLERSFVTLVGEDRANTRLVWEINDRRYDPSANADGKGTASFNLHNASDVVIDNLTIDNPAKLGGKPFVVFSTGTGTRIVIQNANVLGLGGDSLSLWTRGLYYHRNIHVTGTYHFVGPRGTCYLSDSVIEVVGSVNNALFNEGMHAEREKFVLQRCRFVSKVPFGLGSNFRDAAWYFIDCEFPETLRPEGKIFIAQSNPARPQPVSAMFKWATDRVYFANSKGPAYPWLQDNLAQSEAKSVAEITPAWTFSGQWDPESVAAPALTKVVRVGDQVVVGFAESVTVKGRPLVALADGKAATYVSGSGTAELTFRAPTPAAATRLSLNGGAILASQAAAGVRAVPDALALSVAPGK